MAINKIVPQYLNKDDDERLVKQVEMVDALNVHVSSDETGNSGVVKNILGTAMIGAYGLEDRILTSSTEVVGSISIPRKQQIIFFLYVDPASGQEHSIMLYDVVTNKVTRLIASDVLNFQANRHVQADVIFNEDDETILYFTDDYNPPRKINVDRLILNKSSIWYDPQDINYYSVDDRLEFLSVCKTPPMEPITFVYSTDTAIAKNNIIDKTFQFAYQYVYKDGEVSAISPYSVLAFSPTVYASTIINAAAEKENNKITLTYTAGNKEVSKVKLLARVGISGAFSIIGEENNPTSSTGTFSFTNDGLFPLVATSEIDKNFDNVPLKAKTQVISGNRLVYGNYVEGYDNINNLNVLPSVVYNPLDASGVIEVTMNQPVNGDPAHFIIDGTALNATYDVGAIIIVKFSVVGNSSTGHLKIYNQTSNQYGYIPVFKTVFMHGSSDSYTVSFGLPSSYNNPSTYVEVPVPLDKVINAGFVTNTSMTRNQILNQVASNLSAKSFTYSWENNGPYYNAYGEITVASQSSAHSLGTPIVAPVNADSVTLDLNQDTGYSVLNKRKIDIEVTDLDLSYVFTNSDPYITLLFENTGSLEEAQSSTITTTIDSLYYLNYQYITFTNIEGLAYNPGYNSFKTSALHNFGIVYYDSKGRSGAVQKIDGVYVAGYGDTARGGNNGGVEVRLELRHTPPSWATKYQIVYGGNENYTDFVQYSVAGAYLKADLSEGDVQTIYLDLQTLQGNKSSYTEDLGANIDYTYTEGDVLRIISYYDSDNVRQFVDGYEYLVLGLENITDGTYLEQKDASQRDTGTFVAIRNEDYSDKDINNFSATAIRGFTDFWGDRVIVEIVSPNRVTSDIVYHEIGQVYDISLGAHVGDSTSVGGFPVVHITNGDVLFKPRKILYPEWDGSAYDYFNYANYDYEIEYVESATVSDFFESSAVNRGRLHGISEEAKQMRRFSSLTYSEPYAFGSGRFSLSSFNLSLGNYSDLEGRYGNIDKIIDQGESIMLFQENKVSLIGINRTFLETLSGEDIVAARNFLGTSRYYAGDFGSSGYPAAIVQRFGVTYFVDVRAQKVIRISADGITNISDKQMSSFFDENLSEYVSQANKKELDIIGGFDPDNDEYVLTAKPRGTFSGFTLAYDHNQGQWMSFYSFVPDFYQNINDRFFSFKPSTAVSVLHEHEAGTTYNNFYGTQYNTSISVVSNYDPSLVKVYNAISTESTHPFSVVVETSDQQSTIGTSNFQKREREFFAQIGGDELASTANYSIVGIVESITPTSITFTGPINKTPIPLGASISIIDNGALTATGNTISSLEDSLNLNVSGTAGINAGDTIVAVTSSSVNGDRIADYYSKITLTNSVSDEKVELFCVNMNFNKSQLHSSLGQNNTQ